LCRKNKIERLQNRGKEALALISYKLRRRQGKIKILENWNSFLYKFSASLVEPIEEEKIPICLVSSSENLPAEEEESR
jgi:hypothetical protein